MKIRKMSRFDQLYRRILISKFFTKGWGKPDNLKKLFEFRQIISTRETCQQLVSKDYPVHIDKEYVQGDVRTLDGHFLSPFHKHLPEVMPKEVQMARFQVILPRQWKTKLKPVCIHLAGTGDHYFWRRRALIAKPLLKEAGIASIILENPFYGVRKPKHQVRSSLHNVSDLFVMGGALVLESLALFHWCERQGLGPLGITGISMGGHMASLAACNWIRPVSLVPCLSWSTASCVFTQGVLSGAIPWDILQSQYYEDSVYQDELRNMIHSPEDDAYMLGQNFVRKFPSSLNAVDRAQASKHREGGYLLHDEEAESLKLSQDTHSQLAGSGSINMIKNDGRHHLSSLDSTDSSTTGAVFENLSENGRSQYQYYTRQYENNAKTLLTRLAKQAAFENRLKIPQKGALSRRKSRTCQAEVLDFMRGVMDEFTHLGNFSVPLDTGLVIIIAAERDAYVPRNEVVSLEKLWPGAEVRYIDSGHVAAFLFRQDAFRKAIQDSFQRQTNKYYS